MTRNDFLNVIEAKTLNVLEGFHFDEDSIFNIVGFVNRGIRVSDIKGFTVIESYYNCTLINIELMDKQTIFCMTDLNSSEIGYNIVNSDKLYSEFFDVEEAFTCIVHVIHQLSKSNRISKRCHMVFKLAELSRDIDLLDEKFKSYHIVFTSYIKILESIVIYSKDISNKFKCNISKVKEMVSELLVQYRDAKENFPADFDGDKDELEDNIVELESLLIKEYPEVN